MVNISIFLEYIYNVNYKNITYVLVYALIREGYIIENDFDEQKELDFVKNDPRMKYLLEIL